MSYITSGRAMRRRDRIEDPTGMIPVMQQPGLGRFALASYLPSAAAMYRREHIASPVCAVDTMQQPGLGDITANDLLSQTMQVPLLGATVNTPLFIAGATMAAIALIMWVSKKGSSVRAYTKRRARRSRAVQAAKLQLAAARAI